MFCVKSFCFWEPEIFYSRIWIQLPLVPPLYFNDLLEETISSLIVEDIRLK